MSALMTQLSTSIEAGSFEEQSRNTLGRLRLACSELIAEVSNVTGRPVRSAVDLERALGVRSTLAWRIYRIATARNPLSEVTAVPGAKAMSHVLAAAATRGVPETAIDEASEALRQFHGFMKAHAGDRKTFNSLVAGLAGPSPESLDLQYRRDAYYANSHVCGQQTQVSLRTLIVRRGQAPHLADVAMIAGFSDLQRLRHGIPVYIGVRLADQGDQDNPFEPLRSDHHSAERGLSLLEEFSSPSLPGITDGPGPRGGTGVLAPAEIGASGACTLFMSGIARDQADEQTELRAPIRTPVAVLITDFIVESGMFDHLVPQAGAYLNTVDPSNAAPEDSDHSLRLPQQVVVESLGSGPAAVATPDLPRYPEMLQHVYSEIGWNPSKFDVYRCRIEYPIMFSTVVMKFRLPEKGNW